MYKQEDCRHVLYGHVKVEWLHNYHAYNVTTYKFIYLIVHTFVHACKISYVHTRLYDGPELNTDTIFFFSAQNQTCKKVHILRCRPAIEQVDRVNGFRLPYGKRYDVLSAVTRTITKPAVCLEINRAIRRCWSMQHRRSPHWLANWWIAVEKT